MKLKILIIVFVVFSQEIAQAQDWNANYKKVKLEKVILEQKE